MKLSGIAFLAALCGAHAAEPPRLAASKSECGIEVVWDAKIGTTYSILMKDKIDSAFWEEGRSIFATNALQRAWLPILKRETYIRISEGHSPFLDKTLYVDPDTGARREAMRLRSEGSADALLLDKIAREPQALWCTSGAGVFALARIMSEAKEQQRMPVIVLYNIPKRDCGGGFSSGGARDAASYSNWLSQIIAKISTETIVILEPDALPNIDCPSLSASDRDERYTILRTAAERLGEKGVHVYMDAGHPRWQSASTMSARLKRAGIDKARGFSINVSNFQRDSECLKYGITLSSLLGGRRFVIDSSRNGNGPAENGEWCNPPGRALGRRPEGIVDPACDGYLWIKRPGESDGACNGGPSAGTFWTEYALGLAARAAY